MPRKLLEHVQSKSLRAPFDQPVLSVAQRSRRAQDRLRLHSGQTLRSNLCLKKRLLCRLRLLAMTRSSTVQITTGVGILLATFAVSTLGSLASAQSLEKYQPVTSERLLHPEPQNWLMYRGTYDSWGYSALNQINTKNVRKLIPVWTFSTGVSEGHQSPPIVNSGVMFITTPQNQVLALDAKTGDLLWRYKRELPEDLFQLHPTNRAGRFIWRQGLSGDGGCASRRFECAQRRRGVGPNG